MSKSRNKKLYQENLKLRAMLKEYETMLHMIIRRIEDECTVTKMGDEEMEQQYRDCYSNEEDYIMGVDMANDGCYDEVAAEKEMQEVSMSRFSEDSKERMVKRGSWF